MNDPLTIALIFAGGGGGSVIRWLVGIGVGERRKGSTFPVGTLLINVSGAFLMGFLSTLFIVDWKDRYGSHLTAAVLTGVLGGYTTFSSFQLDTAHLRKQGGPGMGALLGRLGRCRSGRGGARSCSSQVLWMTGASSDAEERRCSCSSVAVSAPPCVRF